MSGKVGKLNSISSQTNQVRMCFSDIPEFRIFFTHTLLMRKWLKKVIQQIGKGTEERDYNMRYKLNLIQEIIKEATKKVKVFTT